MKNNQVEAFLANVKHAIQNHESVLIGGGEFNSEELSQVMNYIEYLEYKVIQKNENNDFDSIQEESGHPSMM